MYKCPKADCRSDSFKADVTAYGVENLNAAGEVQDWTFSTSDQTGPVRCAECGARAEWIDERQGELFAIEPMLYEPEN